MDHLPARMCAAKAKGGADSVRSAIERRQEILERLSVRRVDTIGNLMIEFGVSRSTIKRDLEIIGLSAPIYTVKGKGGGVRVMNGYYYGRRYLKPDQVDLLKKLIPELAPAQQQIIQSILDAFAMPLCRAI